MDLYQIYVYYPMEKLDVKPHNNPSNKCLVCHRPLITYSPTQEEKIKYAKQLNDAYNLGLEPKDVILLGHPCPCGQAETQIFYWASEEWKDLI